MIYFFFHKSRYKEKQAYDVELLYGGKVGCTGWLNYCFQGVLPTGKWSESESCSVVSDSLRPHGLYGPRNSPAQNTGVGSLSLLQGISQPRDQARVSCNAGGFFTNWAMRNQCKERGKQQNRKDWKSLQEIRDTKGRFHAKTGSIKDWNGMDLTEEEHINKRWQEHTEKLYKKRFSQPW